MVLESEFISLFIYPKNDFGQHTQIKFIHDSPHPVYELLCYKG